MPPGRGTDPDLLWRATHRVSHRGPDDWGFLSARPVHAGARQSQFWRSREEGSLASACQVGLGSRRLSILDLTEAGRMPMNLPGTDLWVAFNGEIYNYVELRSELAAEFHFTTGTDTEVLLAAYAKWGPECLKKLNGMFAFALWDGAQNKLFAARDPFGEKPLYYAWNGRRLILGSELKQFLEDEDFDRAPDWSALSDFLLLSVQDHDERTFLANAKQLPAAHWLEMNAATGELKGPHRYWEPEIGDDIDTSHDAGFEENLRFLLNDSVRIRLRSDVRVGLCLSGGIDSTTICALAAKQVANPSALTGYTISFPGDPDDESELAAKAAARAGVRHVRATFAPDDLWSDLRHFVSYQDGPTGQASQFASWRVFQAAREDGAVVLLNGQGGDELFGGYDKFYFFWLQMLLARGQWMRFAVEAATYLRVNGLEKWSLSQGRRYLPMFLRRNVMGMWRFGTPEFRAKAAVHDREIGSGNNFNRRLWKDLSRFSLPCLLHWEDRNSMAVSAEARLPFLDHRIAEAALRTSTRTKLAHGFTKYSVRSAMRDLLPDQVCWLRKKRGFNTPADDWFRRRLVPQMRDLLSASSPLSDFLDRKALLGHYEDYVAGEPDSLTDSDWFRLAGTTMWLDELKSAVRAEPAVVA